MYVELNQNFFEAFTYFWPKNQKGVYSSWLLLNLYPQAHIDVKRY